MKNDKNIKNMFKELDHEFPEDFGLYAGLTIDACDFEDNYDDNTNFDETMLDKLTICYKNQYVAISRYCENNWEITDESFIKCEYFREIGKILDIVMKHLSKIEFKYSN